MRTTDPNYPNGGRKLMIAIFSIRKKKVTNSYSNGDSNSEPNNESNSESYRDFNRGMPMMNFHW